MLARSKKSFGGNYDDGLVDGMVCVVKVAPFCALMVLFWALNSQVRGSDGSVLGSELLRSGI